MGCMVSPFLVLKELPSIFQRACTKLHKKHMNGPVSPLRTVSHFNHSGDMLYHFFDANSTLMARDTEYFWCLFPIRVFFSEPSRHLFVCYPIIFVFNVEFEGSFLFHLRAKRLSGV